MTMNIQIPLTNFYIWIFISGTYLDVYMSMFQGTFLTISSKVGIESQPLIRTSEAMKKTRTHLDELISWSNRTWQLHQPAGVYQIGWIKTRHELVFLGKWIVKA